MNRPARRAAAALATGLLLAGAPGPARAQAADRGSRVVKVVADARLTVTTPAGSGELPLYVSHDWARPQPEVDRAVIVLHGYRRNADTYLRSAERAMAEAGADPARTLLVVPQFLSDADAAAHGLPDGVLRWSHDSWEGGGDAQEPAALSSFDALDTILARLGDRTLFPSLREVVLAGHSGGAQVAQRYAVLGHGEAMLGNGEDEGRHGSGGTATRAAIRLRYVVANPSSYAYFSPDRPVFENGAWSRAFAVPNAAAACPGYNVWKYGMAGLPRYAGGTAAALEAAYAAREVVYLLGTADTDPNHPALDRSCMAEAQGPYRYARGTVYVAYMHQRHPKGLNHVLLPVPGVAHDGGRMFGSACGLAALFNKPGCTPP